MAATGRGHEAWYLGVGDFAYDPDGTVKARARRRPQDAELQVHARCSCATCRRRKAVKERIDVGELDVLMLRNDPSEDEALAALGADRRHHLRPAGDARTA